MAHSSRIPPSRGLDEFEDQFRLIMEDAEQIEDELRRRIANVAGSSGDSGRDSLQVSQRANTNTQGATSDMELEESEGLDQRGQIF